MSDSQTRVRWTSDEKLAVATEMHRLRLQAPDKHNLDLIRGAQAVLPPERQREIKAWSVVETALQPLLDELARKPGVATSEALSAQSTEVLSSPAGVAEASGDASPVVSVSAAPAQAPAPDAAEDGAAVPTNPVAAPAEPGPTSMAAVVAAAGLDLLATEAVLIAAAQSPAVERAFEEMMFRAMFRAAARVAAEEKNAAPTPVAFGGQTRVLVAGFGSNDVRAMESVLGEAFELRSWLPRQGPQMFDTLAKVCSVAIVPEESGDDVDEALKQYKLRVIRHEGNPSRLPERLSSLLQ